jgi:ribosomal protein L21E
MDAKYKIGEKVDINLGNEILQVEVFGYFNGQSGIVYSVKTPDGFIILQDETDILEKPNE